MIQDSDDKGDKEQISGQGKPDQAFAADNLEPEDSHPPRAPSPPSSHASEEDTAERLQQAKSSAASGGSASETSHVLQLLSFCCCKLDPRCQFSLSIVQYDSHIQPHCTPVQFVHVELSPVCHRYVMLCLTHAV